MTKLNVCTMDLSSICLLHAGDNGHMKGPCKHAACCTDPDAAHGDTWAILLYSDVKMAET